MKNLFVSAGLVALGAAALHQSAKADDVNSPKNWNVSGTLRGFYDDNYEPGSANSGTFGMEVSPAVSYHLPLQQTDLGIRYTYGLYYYQERQDKGQDAFDQTHQVDLWVDHAFNNTWKAKFNDTFAAGQEPELLQSVPGSAFPVTHRVKGDNYSNHGSVALSTDWTRLFSSELTYNNGYFDYANSGARVVGGTIMTGSNGGASLAGLLDRVEESAALDLKWHVTMETTLFVGYQLSIDNYIGNEPIAINTTGSHVGFVHHSQDRDSLTHYGYAGIQHQFTANLGGTARGGVLYADNYNDPLNKTTSWAPYADVSLTYTYLPGSYASVGFTHNINATDQVQPDTAGNLTQYAESSVGYLSLNHRITSKLTGTAIGRIQYSTYQGGAASNETETDYGLGLNLNYMINQHFSVDAGYNYDNVLTSGAQVVDVGYSRNRVYLGLTANY
jgi:hypothetical protein